MVTYPWLSAPAEAVADTARTFLGWHLTAHGVTVRLTEDEAYSGLGQDPASHAHRGPTARNEVMFGPAGHLYLYRIYGIHLCANIVCGPEGKAAAVLLRAGAVVGGLETARARRPLAKGDRDLAAGPAKLVQVLALDASAYGSSVVDGTGAMTMTPPPEPVPDELIEAGPRVGVTSAFDVAWRFWLKGDPTVSAYRRHKPRRR
jgi:DNA-3-methyladenine glycosylase